MPGQVLAAVERLGVEPRAGSALGRLEGVDRAGVEDAQDRPPDRRDHPEEGDDEEHAHDPGHPLPAGIATSTTAGWRLTTRL